MKVNLILPLLLFTNSGYCWSGTQNKKTIQKTCVSFLYYLFISVVVNWRQMQTVTCATQEPHPGSANILFLTVLHAFWNTL